ncbi:WD repeat-containing protein 33 [Coemansia sp. RSA 1199]|nr:WD repeat-containing protein 33 [Coemansia sp. RSA 1199]
MYGNQQQRMFQHNNGTQPGFEQQPLHSYYQQQHQYDDLSSITAHDTPIHAMEWSRDGQGIITGDHDGIIKYWQPNLSNLKAFQTPSIHFSPTDLKFVSASDDQQLKI